MGKRSVQFLAIGLTMAMLLATLAGCGGNTTPPTASANAGAAGSAAPESTPPDASGKVHRLSFSYGDSVTSTLAKFYQELADKTFEATNGGLEISLYCGGTLFGHLEVMEGVLSGAADMGWFYTPWAPEQFPLTEVISLPLVYENQLALTYTLQELHSQVPELQEELSRLKIVNLYAQPINYLVTDFPISTPNDFRGKQLRCTAGGHAECLTAWGASPVSLASTEIYDAMSKGVIQGSVFELSGVKTQALHEVLDYYVYIPMFSGPFMTIMNNDSYNSIPDEYKEIFDEIWCSPQTSYDIAEVFAQDAEDSRVIGIEEFGIEEIYPDEAMLDLFRPAAVAFKDKWLKKNTTDTFDSQEYLDLAKSLYEEGCKKFPEWNLERDQIAN